MKNRGRILGAPASWRKLRLFNAKNVINKLDELRNVSDATRFDVIAICETWPFNEISDDLGYLATPGFVPNTQLTGVE